MSHFLERLTYLARQREPFADGLSELRDSGVCFCGRFRGNNRHQADGPKWSKMTQNVSRAAKFAVAQQDRRSASRRIGHFAL